MRFSTYIGASPSINMLSVELDICESKRMFVFSVLMVLSLCHKCQAVGFKEIDRAQYDAGKVAYELMDAQSKMPNYGKCWENAIVIIGRGCKLLTDDMQSRLALAYLNCFLETQGRNTYECDHTKSIQECTRDMVDVDRGSLATFFTHTQNICYFLEAQNWHQETDKTILNLVHYSDSVASQLEASTELQKDLLKKQNQTLLNQEEILSKANNLSNIISSSTDNLQTMFSEFQKTTAEQKDVLSDIFDKINKLQTLVIEELTGFYSAVYYVIALLVSYLLTTTPRTSSARLIMFLIFMINFIVERFIIHRMSDSQEILYQNHWICRYFFMMLALIVCIICACRYQDFDKINNQLLLGIKKQVSEIKTLLDKSVPNRLPVSSDHIDSASPNNTLSASADSTGYDSDSAVSSYSEYSSGSSSYDSKSSDYSYHPPSEARSMTDSISTCTSASLTGELEHLKSSTPMTELERRVAAWSTTGYYRHSTPDINSQESCNSTEHQAASSPVTQLQERNKNRYNLRSRKKNVEQNPVIKSESPSSFFKAVKNAEKNTRGQTNKLIHESQQENNSLNAHN